VRVLFRWVCEHIVYDVQVGAGRGLPAHGGLCCIDACVCSVNWKWPIVNNVQCRRSVLPGLGVGERECMWGLLA